MAWLTALGVNPSSLAAARNDPVRAAASKARRARRGNEAAMRQVNTIHLSVQIWRIFVRPDPNHIRANRNKRIPGGNMLLKGKTAIISGPAGARGIAFATAKTFPEQGARAA